MNPAVRRVLAAVLLTVAPLTLVPPAATAAPDALPLVFSSKEGIVRINSDGSGRQVIAAPPSPHHYSIPDLSPDGTRVVFSDCDIDNVHVGSACSLAVVNIDGSGLRPLTGGYQSPRWSPDGRRVAFGDFNGNSIAVVNADGSDRRVVTPGAYVDWSPDGKTLVVPNQLPGNTPTRLRSALFTVPVDGSESPRQLTPAVDGGISDPSWSPDGTQIAFRRHWEDGGFSAVNVVNADGSGQRDVLYRAEAVESYGRPAWSPDSRRLAIAEVQRTGDEFKTPLFVQSLVDGRRSVVTPDSGRSVSWATPTAPQGCSGGYWLVARDGGVFAFGTAGFYGSTGNRRLRKPIVGMAATPFGAGYRLVAGDGGIFSFGDATFHGSTGDRPLNKPIVGMAATPSGHGYWLVAGDGGVFAFGDATFHGSTGSMALNKPIVGLAPARPGGYWLVAGDGGVFAFGEASPIGSAAAPGLPAPVIGASFLRGESGLLLTVADGEVVPLNGARYCGSLYRHQLAHPLVGGALSVTKLSL